MVSLRLCVALLVAHLAAVYGCSSTSSADPSTPGVSADATWQFTGTTNENHQIANNAGCIDHLMTLPRSAFTASTFDTCCGGWYPWQSYITNYHGWNTATSTEVGAWIQFDLGAVFGVSGVTSAIHGFQNGYFVTATLDYSLDGSNFVTYPEVINGPANPSAGGNYKHTTFFAQAFNAQFVKLTAITAYGWPGGRFEVLSCGATPTCELLEIEGAEVEVVVDELEDGSTVNRAAYRCHENHLLVGDESLYCIGGTDKWVGKQPTCERLRCFYRDCHHNEADDVHHCESWCHYSEHDDTETSSTASPSYQNQKGDGNNASDEQNAIWNAEKALKAARQAQHEH